MEFFERIDTESDEDSDYRNQADENTEPQIDPYWFQVTDDDEEEEEHRVFGKEKKTAEIQTALDTYDYTVSTQSWTDAVKQLKDLLSLVSTYERKYNETPQIMMEYIRDHVDLAEELEGKTSADFKRPRDFTSLRELRTLIDELRDKFAKEAEEEERQERAAEGDDDEENYSEAVLSKRILEIVQAKRSAGRLAKLAAKCDKLGYTALRISALGHFTIATLNEERKFLVDQRKWEEAFHAAEECFSLLQANPGITLVEDIRRVQSGKGRVAAIVDGFTAVLSALQIRLLNVAQSTKCSDVDYLWVPLAENRLSQLTDRALAYYRAKERSSRRHVVECCQILLSLIGYRPQKVHDMLYSADDSSSSILSPSMLETTKEILKVITAFSAQGMQPAKVAAVCYISYQYGLLGQFRKGRDVLLRAGVPAFIAEKDCTVQLYILYNRVIAQLGLAAFVANEIEESYALLGPLWEKYNPAVLIGQAIPQSKDIEDEIKNRDQTVQHHYEIPHQHLELAAMLSALVVDTVNEAKKPYERSRVQKFFYRAISHPPQLLCSNPSSVKDQIFAAHKALKAGDYLGAKQVVESMKAWRTMANGESVLANYLGKLKEAAFRIFCFSNRTSFSTFSVEQLAIKYDIEPKEAQDILNDMIWDNDSLVAHWDRDDSFLYVDRSNPTRLQHIVMGAADSVVELVPYKEPRARANEGRGRGGAGGRGRGRGRGRGN